MTIDERKEIFAMNAHYSPQAYKVIDGSNNGFEVPAPIMSQSPTVSKGPHPSKTFMNDNNSPFRLNPNATSFTCP